MKDIIQSKIDLFKDFIEENIKWRNEATDKAMEWHFDGKVRAYEIALQSFENLMFFIELKEPKAIELDETEKVFYEAV